MYGVKNISENIYSMYGIKNLSESMYSVYGGKNCPYKKCEPSTISKLLGNNLLGWLVPWISFLLHKKWTKYSWDTLLLQNRIQVFVLYCTPSIPVHNIRKYRWYRWWQGSQGCKNLWIPLSTDCLLSTFLKYF